MNFSSIVNDDTPREILSLIASKLLQVPATRFLVKKIPPFAIPIAPSIGPLIKP
jgi:hypothetical protein